MRPCGLSIVALASACGLAATVTPARAQVVLSPALADAKQRVFPFDPAGPGGGGVTDTTGPDVIVGEIMNNDNSPPNLSLAISPLGSTATLWGFGLGTESCNIGNQNVEWIGQCNGGGSNRKPVIPQNMFKLSTVNGATRFEQIGQSWLKHAFTALTYSNCGSCSGQGGSVLGVGCADPYTAGRNGSQSNPTGSNGGTGPRYEINPFTGDYPWPMGTLPPGTTDGTTRRIKVLKTDLVLTNATSPVQFIGEAIYVTRDDARYGNNHNNASYRRMFCTSTTSGTFTLEGSGWNNGIHRMIPAIYAWRDFGKIAITPGSPFDSGVMISEVSEGQVYSPPNSPPVGDGWFIVGSQATDLGGGTFHYEYAIYNFNSDRMGGSFSVPIPSGASITNVAWKGVDSHSGVAADDATRNAAWTSNVSASSVSWAAPVPYSGRDYAALPITSITTGSPATVTSAGHGLATGDIILIRGTNAMISSGTCMPAATSVNGAYRVTVTNANQFTIPVPSSTTVNVAGNTGSFGVISTLGNGMRWGTLYNFRFDSTSAPGQGTATLGLYKQDQPGYPNSLFVNVWLPSSPPPPPCYPDVNGDGVLDSNDFNAFLINFLNQERSADCNDDGTYDSNDFNCLLVKFLAGCP